jgi:hypothetical protein
VRRREIDSESAREESRSKTSCKPAMAHYIVASEPPSRSASLWASERAPARSGRAGPTPPGPFLSMHCTSQHATWSPTYFSTHRAWHDFCHCAMFLRFMYLWTEGHVQFTRQDMNEWMWNLTILMYPLVGTSFGRGHLHFTQQDMNEWMWNLAFLLYLSWKGVGGGGVSLELSYICF